MTVIERKKMTLEEAYTEFVESLYNNPPEHDENLVLGNYEDFLPEEFEIFQGDIFVLNNQVFVSCPSKLHEFTSDILSQCIREGINAGIQGSIKSVGNASRKLFNVFGCRKSFNKQPDFSFKIDLRDLFPFLVGEVAFRNESLDLLLNEAMVWLNEFSGVSYCICLKLSTNPLDFFFHLIVCKRNRSQIAEEEKNSRLKRIQAVEDPVGELCRPCLKPRAYSAKQIEEAYNLEVVFMKTVDSTNMDEDITFELHGLSSSTVRILLSASLISEIQRGWLLHYNLA